MNQSFTITAIDFTTLVPVGSPAAVASATATTVNMTSSTGQTSAVWLPAKQTVGNGFTTQFSFQITAGSASTLADGFAFVIQNSSSGTSTLGTTGAGGYIGYQGIPNSLAIEFDTFHNNWDPNANHVAIQSNGMAANTADHNAATLHVVNSTLATTLSNGAVHAVTITYDGTSHNFVVMLDQTQILTTPVDLATLGLDPGGLALVGFTAATGSGSENTIISNWSFSAN